MDSPEFKPFELKDFDSEVSVQEAATIETDGFKPMNYSAGEDYAVLGEVDEKTETEKIDLSENFHTDHFQREDSLLTNACLLYTSPSPRDATLSRMPSSA